MAFQTADRVWDLTTSIGTGPITLSNSPPNAYRSFSFCSTNDTIYIAIAHQTLPQWEVSLATFNSSGPTLTRTTVVASSNSNAAVNFGSGTKDVLGVWPAVKLNQLAPIMVSVRSSGSATVNVSAATDYFLYLDPTSNAITVNLPAGQTGLTFLIKDGTGQSGTHNITITPAAGNIDGAGTYVISQNYASVAVTYTGTQWSVN